MEAFVAPVHAPDFKSFRADSGFRNCFEPLSAKASSRPRALECTPMHRDARRWLHFW
jgi:hypothetical protein